MGRLFGSRLFRAGFGLLGLGFLVLAFAAAWDQTADAVVPAAPILVLALAAVAAGHGASARGWVALFEGDGSPLRLAHGLFVAQFGKYVPGGVWHVVGQVGLAVGPGVTAGQAAAAMPVHVLVQAAAAAALGAPLAVAAGVPGPIRVGALCGLALLPLMHRRWMAAAAARLRRWRGLGEDVTRVPSQPAILRAFAWSTLGMAGAGVGFALLLGAVGGTDPLPLAASGFGLAWLTGFLALPFPSGIGVREAVMLGTFSSSAAVIVAASVAHRLVQIAAEALLALATWRPG